MTRIKRNFDSNSFLYTIRFSFKKLALIGKLTGKVIYIQIYKTIYTWIHGPRNSGSSSLRPISCTILPESMVPGTWAPAFWGLSASLFYLMPWSKEPWLQLSEAYQLHLSHLNPWSQEFRLQLPQAYQLARRFFDLVVYLRLNKMIIDIYIQFSKNF